jgi:hypothetical protein
MEIKKIAVLYLCRFANPPQASRKFLKSLLRFRAGVDYELVYLLKGFPEGRTDPALARLKTRLHCPVREVRVSDEFFMINALLEGAAQLPHEAIFPLSSWSFILADNWLASFVSAFDRLPGCVVAGATGSYDPYFTNGPSPNVHLRTTAFLIDRKRFLTLDRGRLRTKTDNNLFESGPNSMTRQLLAGGGKVVVVGRDGRCWLPEEWPKSHTFFSGQQENLIIADNQTLAYEGARLKERRSLARNACGDECFAEPPGFVRRVRRFFRENNKKLRRAFLRSRQKLTARVSESQVKKALLAAEGPPPQQDLAEYSAFVAYLANCHQPVKLALLIGSAPGGHLKLLQDFFPIEQAITVDIRPHSGISGQSKISPPDKTEIILEITGDSHSQEVYDRLQPYTGKIDFVLLNADQTYTGLMRDLKLAQELCLPGALFVLTQTKAVPDCHRVLKWLTHHPDFEFLQDFDQKFGISLFRCLEPGPPQPFSSHSSTSTLQPAS